MEYKLGCLKKSLNNPTQLNLIKPSDLIWNPIMEYNGVLTLNVGATKNTPVDYSMDWLTVVNELSHVVVVKSLR